MLKTTAGVEDATTTFSSPQARISSAGKKQRRNSLGHRNRKVQKKSDEVRGMWSGCRMEDGSGCTIERNDEGI